MSAGARKLFNSLLLLAIGVVLATAAGSVFAAWKIAARNGLEAADLARLSLIFAKTLWSKSAILELSLFAPVLALLFLLKKPISACRLLPAPLMPALVHFRYFSDEASLFRMKELGLNSDGLFYWFVFLLTLTAAALGARGKTQADRAVSRWNLLPIGAVLSAVIFVIVFFLMRSYSRPENGKIAPVRKDVRVFLIGIDGATWDVMTPMLERGELPGFAALMEGGSSGPLKSIKPTLSPLIWTSIATGKLPDKHGILGFFEYSFPGLSRHVSDIPYPEWMETQLKNGTIEKVSSTSATRRAAAFWNILNGAGLSAGLVRWQATWPPESVNGYVVTHRAFFDLRREARKATGRLPSGRTTHPPELLAKLAHHFALSRTITREEISRFVPMDDELWRDFHGKSQYKQGDFLSTLKFIYNEDRFFNKAGLHLLDEHPTDMFAFYLYGIDAIQHYFWKYYRPGEFRDVDPKELKAYGGLIENYYRFADRTVGEIAARADERTVIIVVSDHGMVTRRPEGSDGYRSGSHFHAPDGIFIARGPGIRQRKGAEASVLDITPTLLRIFGLPLADDFDGSPINSVLDPAVYPEIQRTVKTYDWLLKKTALAKSESESEERRRLKSLGYIK